MTKLRLQSGLRRQRSVMVLPDVERWIEQEATRAGVSFSEAMNRLLMAYRQFHREHNGDGMEGFEARMTDKVAHLTNEVEKVKSNLYLLQTMHDRLAAKVLTPPQYEAWRQEVKSVMDKRKGEKA